MGGVKQDIRFALRLLVKDRWFTLVAVLALGLGIGLNTTVFTFVNAVLIRGLPYKDEQRILHINLRNTTNDSTHPLSFPDFEDLHSGTKTFSALSGYRGASFNMSDSGRPPERVSGTYLSANAFSMLGQPLLLGRDFAPGEDRAGAEPVVILGYGIWRSRYGGDPDIVGRTLKINEEACTIIGVMPEGVKFPNNADMWRPLVPDNNATRRGSRSMWAFGRLAPGTSRAQAEAELRTISGRLAAEHPETNKDLEAVGMTFNERFNGGPIRIVFLALLGAVGFVLLIACANVANLLLSKSSQRAREVAVRVALGASRARIVRQLLIESTLLALIGGVLGLAIAWVGIRLFDAAVAGIGKPYWIVFKLDPLVFMYLAGVCLATGIIFGIAPALQVSKTNVNELLKEGGRGNAGGRRARRLRSTLVVAEIVLTLVLLAGAGLMIRSFLKLYSMQLGADTTNVLTMRLILAEQKYPKPDQRQIFYDALLGQVAAVSGVEAAAVASNLPLQGGAGRPLEIEGRPQDGERQPEVSTVTVSPRYFDVLGVGIRRGRAFTEADGGEGAEAVIVNERFVARFFPDEDPIGRRIRFHQRDATTPAPPWLTIVGVSPTIRQGDPQSIEPDAVAYITLRQQPFAGMTIMTRSRVPAASLTPQVRDAVRAVDPEQPVFNVLTMEDVLSQARWPYRIFGSMFAIFAFIALVLSSVGIYAVTAYSVAQRRQEIGVRMALGAQSSQVSWLVLRQGLIQLAIALPLGLAAAYPVTIVLRSLVVQIPAFDPVTFVGISILIVIVTLTACVIPARRATRLDPVVALRND